MTAYVNPAALASYPNLPDWLHFAQGNTDLIEHVVTRVDVDGTTFLLVIPRHRRRSSLLLDARRR